MPERYRLRAGSRSSFMGTAFRMSAGSFQNDEDAIIFAEIMMDELNVVRRTSLVSDEGRRGVSIVETLATEKPAKPINGASRDYHRLFCSGANALMSKVSTSVSSEDLAMLCRSAASVSLPPL